MSALIREVRLKDKPEAAMFAAAMGASVEPSACRHDLSHVVQDAGETSAAVLACALEHGGLRLEIASSDARDATTSRRLLDTSLMKARAEGASLVRVTHWPTGSGDPMWAGVEWLGRLGEITEAPHRVPAPNHPRAAILDPTPPRADLLDQQEPTAEPPDIIPDEALPE